MVFREEWREDLFYYLVSSLFVQILTYLTLAPSNFVIHAQDLEWDSPRENLPWIVQLVAIMLLNRPLARNALAASCVSPCAIPVGLPRGASFRQVDGLDRGRADALP